MLTALLALAAASSPLEYGAQPTYPNAVSVSEQAIREKLVDPQSALFKWPYNFVTGSLKGLLTKRYTGYWTCGRLNSRNKMGGYSGESWVMVVVKDGVATMADVGEDQSSDPTNMACASAVKNGGLPPAPTPFSAPQKPMRIGIQFQASPIGVLLLAVAPGSPADRAGLKVGQLITSVNGHKLAGMDAPTMIAAVQSSSNALTYSIMGTGDIRVPVP
jgi:hypothetical protein